jgi:hypothetical protein
MSNEEAVQRGIENAFCYAAQAVQQAALMWEQAAHEYMRPSVVFKPTLMKWDKYPGVWTAAYGGVCAPGSSPDEALRAFDEAWVKKEKQT